eukprot:CAMPEP_0183784232 /NCGR_PEP_ID=MMETSP0739-20130205/65449_1 /TAXON_ID=385413 /ORGANISM="Thalassiosira miniscula, Strain CCMP1093" /LENGTH=43 /DNA_ID= /DNA_START= /DNA_END= /DNA_ORIENTATION=
MSLMASVYLSLSACNASIPPCTAALSFLILSLQLRETSRTASY